MPDNERARIRGIMYEPSSVWLATENSGDRWLTDQFVLYKVTGSEVLRNYTFHICDSAEAGECSCPPELPDGPYQLMATGDWRAEPRVSIPEPDIEGYFEIMASHIWYSAEPSEWSVFEHPGKAMLWAAAAAPCLLGESTWSSIKRHHPDCEVAYALNRGAGVFRFSAPMGMSGGPVDDPYDAPPLIPFAYAAGIQIPEGQEDIAYEIARALVSTSNRKVG